MNDYFSETILPRQKITNPSCPCCHSPLTLKDKIMQCCSLTAEAVLVVEPPPVEIVRVIHPDLASTPMKIDPNSIEPSLISIKEPRAASRKAWIAYLPLDGIINAEVFRCFAEHQIPLPRCPRCLQPLEFREDASSTEKPFCSENSCKVCFCPSHFPAGTVGIWKRFVRAFPLEADQFRLAPKAFNASFVEPNELRSISKAEYWQHAAMYAATSVISEIEIDALEEIQTPPDAVEEAQDSPQPQRDDTCEKFIHTVICEDPMSFITRRNLYSAYEKWCTNTYSYCETRNALFEKVRQIENVKEDRKRVDSDQLERGFLGIRLL